MVRDEQERHAFALQFRDAPEKPLDFVAVELRGRFVEDDEARAIRKRPRDLDQLARFDRQVARARVFAHVDLPVAEQRARVAPHRAPVDDAVPRGLPVDEQILRDAQIANDRRMLIDARHAFAPRVAVGKRRRRHAGEADLAGIRLAQAGQDRHERRFAGPVTPDERVRLAGHHAHAHVPQRGRRAEALAYAQRFDHRRHRTVCRVGHFSVLPHRLLSSTFAFVTSGAGSWSSRMPGCS